MTGRSRAISMMMAFITEIRRLSQPSPEAGACPYLPEAQPDSARVEERARGQRKCAVLWTAWVCVRASLAPESVGFLNPSVIIVSAAL